jgi:hypothetical protein
MTAKTVKTYFWQHLAVMAAKLLTLTATTPVGCGSYGSSAVYATAKTSVQN